MVKRWGAILILSLIMATLPVCAEVDVRGADLKVSLVSEVTAIAPGQPFTVALHMAPGEGWHTYWKAPGIVGVPTHLTWDLPAGFKAGEIQWPAPERVIMARLTAYGFRRPVNLLVEITPPADLPIGLPVTLRAKGAWMCCSKTCHPGFGDFSLTLPVKESAAWDETWHPQIQAEREAVPKSLPGWQAAVRREKDTIFLTLRPDVAREIPENAEIYFFSDDNQVDSDSPQIVKRRPDGSIELALTRPDFAPENPAVLSGLIFLSTGWPELQGARHGQISASWAK